VTLSTLFRVGGPCGHCHGDSWLKKGEIDMKQVSRYPLSIILAALMLLNLSGAPSESGANASFAGRVIDSSDGSVIPGAVLTLVEFKIKTTTDADGHFTFVGPPSGRVTLGVHRDGYQSRHLDILLPLDRELEIALQPGAHFEEEITVSAGPRSADLMAAPMQVDLVDQEQIRRESRGSLGEAVSQVPGVRNSATGAANGLPVIRGQTNERILVVNDGVVTQYQGFSLRHMPNVDPLDFERVEIIRGPASVLYGPGAMGGVISLIQPDLPVAGPGEIMAHGSGQIGYSSNNGERLASVKLEGAFGNLGWRAGYTDRSAGDAATPTTELEGTDYVQRNATLAMGYSGEWGRIRIHWNHWDNNFGFYRPAGFRIDLKDNLAGVDAVFPTPAGDVEVLAAWNSNVRKAFPPALAGAPAVDLKLTGQTGEFRWHHRPWSGFRGTAAVNLSFGQNTDRALKVLLPEYDNRILAVSLFEEYRAGRLTDDLSRWVFSGGLRYDTKDLDVAPDLPRNLPDGLQRSWQAPTASGSALYRINSSLAVFGSVGRGWRAPSEFELFANGVHGGVAAVQLGNLNLAEETSINLEGSLRLKTDRCQGYLTVFNNRFQNYIYMANTGQIQNDLPVFRYEQTDASIAGVEGRLDAMLTKGWSAGVGFDAMRSRNESTGTRLPLTPPIRFNILSQYARPQWWKVLSPYVRVQVSINGEGKISGPDEPFGTPTDAYATADLFSGGVIRLGKEVLLGLDLSVFNLFNTTYTDFCYTYKQWAPCPGRDVRFVTRIIF
jgi:outer membrane receptor protein involved in Fe transport